MKSDVAIIDLNEDDVGGDQFIIKIRNLDK
jgi:hypothetical protein